MTKSQRLRRVLWAAGLLGAFCAVLALLRPPCPLLALTGLYCPACGISRMFRALLRLDVPAAWRYNRRSSCCWAPWPPCWPRWGTATL